jgi:hypothetical protein
MIRVDLPGSPVHYTSKVRTPGELFLQATPIPSNPDWQKHNYWKEIHEYLYQALRGICMYCASWTPRRRDAARGLDSTSIDHYIPKSAAPERAYDWDNFRLCRSRLNHRKGNFVDVLDPCSIANGWFTLDFSTFLIQPTSDLEPAIGTGVRSSIERLQLNTDPDYVNERIAVIRLYSLDKVDLPQLTVRYPFIGHQILHQDFDVRFKPRLRDFFTR